MYNFPNSERGEERKLFVLYLIDFRVSKLLFINKVLLQIKIKRKGNQYSHDNFGEDIM